MLNICLLHMLKALKGICVFDISCMDSQVNMEVPCFDSAFLCPPLHPRRRC